MKRCTVVVLGLLSAAGCAPAARTGTAPHTARPPASAQSLPPDPEPWRAQAPVALTARQPATPAPEIATLSNGLTLLVLRKPARVVSLSVVVRTAGLRSVGKTGLAALTARMLGEGTRNKTSLELAESTESLGTTLDTDSDRDWLRASMDVLSTDLGQALGALAEVVTSPRFDAKDFERVRAQWLDGLAQDREDPQRIAGLVAVRVLLGSPEGDPVNGAVRDVKALTVTDLVAFHRTAFVPKNAALVVTGDVTLADVRPLAERALGAWRGAAVPAPEAFTPPSAPAHLRVMIVDRPGSVQSVLLAIQPFPRRSEPGHEARELMSAVVAGLFTSRVNHNLREEHAYTYGAFGTGVETARWGAYVLSTSVETPVTGAALVELIKELGAARGEAKGKPITADEIAHARSELTSNAGAHLEHTGRLLDDLTTMFAERLPADTFSGYPARLEATPREQVQRAARELLVPERLIVVAVGDRAKIQHDLETHGFAVEAVDPALLD